MTKPSKRKPPRLYNGRSYDDLREAVMERKNLALLSESADQPLLKFSSVDDLMSAINQAKKDVSAAPSRKGD